MVVERGAGWLEVEASGVLRGGWGCVGALRPSEALKAVEALKAAEALSLVRNPTVFLGALRRLAAIGQRL